MSDTEQTLVQLVESEEESSLFDWHHYRVGYFCTKNRSKSEKNEDSLYIIGGKKQLIAGISDGAGGHPKGAEAAAIAARRTLEYFKKHDIDDVKVMDLIEGINEEILALKVGAHTTFSLISIKNDFLRSYSVGDSETICWNAVSNSIYSNIPQTAIGYSIEAGHIEQEDSLDDPDRYIVDNMLGDPIVRVEVSSKIELKKGHTVLVGSDGLFDNLSHEELSHLIAKGSFENAFDELCNLCRQQAPETWKKDDDISFIAIRKVKS